ncbi:Cro/CI family transcriptional regulator [Vibrio sp. SCSIO 43136]|uniref:Cro/CI family transcriptional regulator n=1 Tax=Vibrio sp. SCSIO 43136 TaxID=2819101 RepID=UPI002075D210|nr:Cro/CI family transcriptional regulator [Vibrio sp. SCSIO 43136]USD68104.1 hypothetical protein J4N39_18185 [Vibrio sp. SCSIO 43136]
MTGSLPRIEMKEAIAYFGTKQKIADELGISHAAVSQWGEYVAKSRTYQLHMLMNTKDFQNAMGKQVNQSCEK